MLGSPPRVRGKLAQFCTPLAPSRITPACAGKTSFIMHRRRRYQDHPRVCGENLKILVFRVAALGSPPRVRGKQVNRDKAIFRHRITPACAGKTSIATQKAISD